MRSETHNPLDKKRVSNQHLGIFNNKLSVDFRSIASNGSIKIFFSTNYSVSPCVPPMENNFDRFYLAGKKI